jgi:hypothetical protein
MPATEAELAELAGVGVAPASITSRRDDPVPRHDGQLGFVVCVAGIADEQAGTARGEAGLDPPVSPTAEVAVHQYSSGRRMVVMDLSASVMI